MKLLIHVSRRYTIDQFTELCNDLLSRKGVTKVDAEFFHTPAEGQQKPALQICPNLNKEGNCTRLNYVSCACPVMRRIEAGAQKGGE